MGKEIPDNNQLILEKYPHFLQDFRYCVYVYVYIYINILCICMYVYISIYILQEEESLRLLKV